MTKWRGLVLSALFAFALTSPALADVRLKGTTNQMEVESSLGARVSVRPQAVGARGSYTHGASTGVLPAALGANSEVFQFRWSHATLKALIRSIRISASVSTTAFAAGVPVGIELRLATGWTGQGTGGTGITFGTDDAKKRVSFAQSAMAAGDLRIATTAALGAGTKTLNGVAMAHVNGQPGTANITFIPTSTFLWSRETGDEYPLFLSQNDGIVIRSVEVPGTGTWKLSVTIEWTELDTVEITGW